MHHRIDLLIALLFLYGVLGGAAVRVWESDETLWGHASSVSPRHQRAISNYAKVLWRQSRETEARQVLQP